MDNVSLMLAMYKACYYGNVSNLERLIREGGVTPDNLHLEYACLGGQTLIILLLKNMYNVKPTLEHLYICVRKNHTSAIKVLGIPFNYECVRIALENEHWELVHEMEMKGLNPFGDNISFVVFQDKIKKYVGYKIVLEKTKLRARQTILNWWPRKRPVNPFQDF